MTTQPHTTGQRRRSGEEWVDDYYRLYEEMEEAFLNNETNQPWKLVPKSKLLSLYGEYGKYGRISEIKLLDCWYLIRDTIVRICINSDIRNGSDVSFFGVEAYDEITDEMWARWYKFVEDGSVSNVFRSFGEANIKGNARYSDRSRTLSDMLDSGYSYEREENWSGLITLLSRIIDIVHGLGPMAHWFVEGGDKTLDTIFEFNPKGASLFGRNDNQFSI